MSDPCISLIIVRKKVKVKNLIVIKVVNPKGKGPYAYETHRFDAEKYTIDSARQSLTQYGLVVLGISVEQEA
jgi:hypothetical protein